MGAMRLVQVKRKGFAEANLGRPVTVPAMIINEIFYSLRRGQAGWRGECVCWPGWVSFAMSVVRYEIPWSADRRGLASMNCGIRLCSGPRGTL